MKGHLSHLKRDTFMTFMMFLKTIRTAVAGAALKGCVRISESRGVKSATFPSEDDPPEDDASALQWPVTHQEQSASPSFTNTQAAPLHESL